jgi:CO/xanthine dehydrogenase Mo-binding subunit
LGLPAEQVRVLVMDTDLTPNGGPTTASRQTYVTGNASRLAAKTLREAHHGDPGRKIRPAARKHPLRGGQGARQRSQPDMREVYSEMKAAGAQDPRVLYDYHAPATSPLGSGGDMHFAFSFASQAAEVEVNTLTGEVRVLHVIAPTMSATPSIRSACAGRWRAAW